jgi:hypothetical protein
MPSWTRRRVWLALLAAGNLILWAGVALAVAFVAGDRLDLGIESALREQATAVASWSSGIEPRIASANTTGDAGSQVSAPVLAPAVLRPSAEQVAGATDVTALPAPTVAVESDVLPGESQSAAEASANPAPLPTQESTPRDPTAAHAAMQFEPTMPITTPLLLVDPEFSTLESLGPELAHSAAGRKVQIRYSEATLNRELAAWLAARPDEPYRSIYVNLGQGQVVVTGDVLVLSLPIRAEATGTVVASGCLPELKLSSVKIGGLFTPPYLRDEVESLLSQALEWYPADYPLCIDQLAIQDGQATVFGHRR